MSSFTKTATSFLGAATLAFGLFALSACTVYEQPAPRAYYPPPAAYVYGPPVVVYHGEGWHGGGWHHGWR